MPQTGLCKEMRISWYACVQMYLWWTSAALNYPKKVHLDGMTKVTIAYLHYDNNQSTFIDAQLSATCMTTMACNCHSMKQFSRVTWYKAAVSPMTKQFCILTYDKTAVWPMTKHFSNLTSEKTAVWPITKQFSNSAYEKKAVCPKINPVVYPSFITKEWVSYITHTALMSWGQHILGPSKNQNCLFLPLCIYFGKVFQLNNTSMFHFHGFQPVSKDSLHVAMW